jgi:hypothetical protein
MPATQLKQTVQHLRRLISDDARSLSDQQLLARYATATNRPLPFWSSGHASMVLGVSRRVLSHNQDAEDACRRRFVLA